MRWVADIFWGGKLAFDFGLVQGVDEFPEASEVTAAVAEDDAWKGIEIGLVGFFFEGVLLHDGASFDDVLEGGVESGEGIFGEGVLKADNESIAHVAVGMVIEVEIGDFGNRFVEIIGDFKKGEVGGGNHAEAEEMFLDELFPSFPIGSAFGVEADDGVEDGFTGLDEGESFEDLVHRAHAAGHSDGGIGFFDEGELASEEEIEVDELAVAGDEFVGGGFEGEGDVESEAVFAGGSLVPGGHDAGARTGHGHVSEVAEAAGELDGGLVFFFVGFGAGGAEEGDFSLVAVGQEDLAGVFHFLEGAVGEFEIGVIHGAASHPDGGGEHFGKEAWIGDPGDLLGEFHEAGVEVEIAGGVEKVAP